MTTSSHANLFEATFERCCHIDASLNERLDAFAAEVRRMSPTFAETVDRFIERLQRSESGTAAPRPGDLLPPFVLPDEEGHLVSLDEMLSEGPVAVAFHRGHWCPYCRLNTRALALAQQEARSNDGQIVAILPDRQQFSAALKSDAQAPFHLLTDLDNGYALSLNLAISIGDEMRRLLSEIGRDLEKYQGNNAWMVPIPATFVVGQDGIIRARFVDPDYRKRMAIEDLLGALKAARQAA